MPDPTHAHDRASFDLKGATLPLTAVVIKTTDLVALTEELERRLSEAPDFFDHDPVLIDLQAISELSGTMNFNSLLALLREHRMVPIAARGGNPGQQAAAREAGLCLVPDAPARHAPDHGARSQQAGPSASGTSSSGTGLSPAGIVVVDGAQQDTPEPAAEVVNRPDTSRWTDSGANWRPQEAADNEMAPTGADQEDGANDSTEPTAAPDPGETQPALFADGQADEVSATPEDPEQVPQSPAPDDQRPLRDIIQDLPTIHPGTVVIDKPLRSGQQIYARNADLVVLAVVSFGAEIMADGNIHVYAPLRGRALAGVRGNTDARIFTTCLEPQLISIAGIYRTSEVALPDEVAGKPAQIKLVGEKLLIEPL